MWKTQLSGIREKIKDVKEAPNPTAGAVLTFKEPKTIETAIDEVLGEAIASVDAEFAKEPWEVEAEASKKPVVKKNKSNKKK